MVLFRQFTQTPQAVKFLAKFFSHDAAGAPPAFAGHALPTLRGRQRKTRRDLPAGRNTSWSYLARLRRRLRPSSFWRNFFRTTQRARPPLSRGMLCPPYGAGNEKPGAMFRPGAIIHGPISPVYADASGRQVFGEIFFARRSGRAPRFRGACFAHPTGPATKNPARSSGRAQYFMVLSRPFTQTPQAVKFLAKFFSHDAAGAPPAFAGHALPTLRGRQRKTRRDLPAGRNTSWSYLARLRRRLRPSSFWRNFFRTTQRARPPLSRGMLCPPYGAGNEKPGAMFRPGAIIHGPISPVYADASGRQVFGEIFFARRSGRAPRFRGACFAHPTGPATKNPARSSGRAQYFMVLSRPFTQTPQAVKFLAKFFSHDAAGAPPAFAGHALPTLRGRQRKTRRDLPAGRNTSWSYLARLRRRLRPSSFWRNFFRTTQRARPPLSRGMLCPPYGAGNEKPGAIFRPGAILHGPISPVYADASGRQVFGEIFFARRSGRAPRFRGACFAHPTGPATKNPARSSGRAQYFMVLSRPFTQTPQAVKFLAKFFSHDAAGAPPAFAGHALPTLRGRQRKTRRDLPAGRNTSWSYLARLRRRLRPSSFWRNFFRTTQRARPPLSRGMLCPPYGAG